MSKTVVGLVDTREQAQSIVDDLIEHRFDRDQISFVAKDEKGEYAAETTPLGSVEKGAGAGAAIGGGAAFLAGLAGLAAIPAIGPVIAGGPILMGIAGAGVGAFAGGIAGALKKGGISEEDARHFAEGVREGGILIVAHPEGERAGEARAIMQRHGAVTEWNADGTPRRMSAAAQREEPGREERLDR